MTGLRAAAYTSPSRARQGEPQAREGQARRAAPVLGSASGVGSAVRAHSLGGTSGESPGPQNGPQSVGGFGVTLAGIRCAAYDRPIDVHPAIPRECRQPHPPEEASLDVGNPADRRQPAHRAGDRRQPVRRRRAKLRELTAEETNPDIGLRVYVYSGGCSGFRYGMMLEDAPTAEDKVLEANGVKVYVDGKSIDLLQGSEIDYVDTLMGAGFTVNNPNAVAACGCGSSFRTADDTGSPKGCSH